MKKLLVLLTLLVGVVGFTTGAFAAFGDPIASTCSTTVSRIDCSVADQGGECFYFDFQTGEGYCPGKTAPTNKAIFSICNCPDSATNFRKDSKIGVRLTILVNGQAGERGAYWSEPSNANIRFGEFATIAEACAAEAYTSEFGPGQFYKSEDLTTPLGTPLAADPDCAVGSGDQATVIVTDRTAGYTIQIEDEDLALSRWWVEIPPIRIDPSVLHNGEIISVRVEFLNQNLGRGICADCPPICAGEVTVAKVCCSESSTCFFPYFTSTAAATDLQPYWNGIAIINKSTMAGTATLTVHQQDGATGTFTTPEIAGNSMFVSALENIEFTGSGLGGAPLFIDVTSTFPTIDGFAMIANTLTGESMGYLCRQ